MLREADSRLIGVRVWDLGGFALWALAVCGHTEWRQVWGDDDQHPITRRKAALLWRLARRNFV